MRFALFLACLALAACGPDGRPKPSKAAQIVKDNPGSAAVWPALLQHCYRGPSCDPMSNFGQGAGQASGQSRWVAWFVESKDVVKEGGEDYGAAISISVFGPRGIGGEGGRPLGYNEVENTLRGVNARRSRLWIEYRTPGGGEPKPYFLAFRSAEVAISPPGFDKARNDDHLAELTADFLNGHSWGPGQDGAKIEIETADDRRVIFTAYSPGMASGAHGENGLAMRRGFEPWVFYFSRNLRDEPAPELMRALEAGKVLSMRIIGPGGKLMLEDGLYPAGYADALVKAKAALADTKLPQTFAERCAEVKDMPDRFWAKADVSPATLSCDPRTEDQKRSAITKPKSPT